MKKKWSSKYKGYTRADQRKIGSIPAFDENNYYTKIYDELKDLCKFIEKEKSVKLTRALKNYILIRLINTSESQLQTITTDLIDHFELKPADLLPTKDLTISLYELDRFRSSNTTNGKIVTQAFKFANIHFLSEIFSKINNLEFFPLLEELTKHPIEKEFHEILQKRNEVVHQLHDIEWSSTILEKKIERIDFYGKIFYIVSWINLDTNPKHNATFEGETKKFNKSLDEFRKIAKKYQL